MIQIASVTSGTTPLLRELILEYSRSIGFDLGFQKFDEELAALPGEYADSLRGAALIASSGHEAAGCVALRKWDDETGEIKRLYVRDRFRGLGIGRALAKDILECARQIGYARVRLDTVPSMATATQLYSSLGFEPIPAYRPNPIPGALFFELTF